MHCQYCGLINGEDDHRCLRCGRRMTGVVIAAPTSYIGANALAVSPMAYPEKDRETSPVRAEAPEQPPLFQTAHLPSQKVIQFPAPFAVPPGNTPAPKPQAAPRSPAKKAAPGAPSVGQGNLDFRPNAAQGERVLATGVPAQVYGDGRVAPPMRRLTAGAMDVAMVLLGFGTFAGAASLAGSFLTSSAVVGAAASGIHGSAFGTGKAVWITLALSLFLISLFYGLVWALASRETVGMNWTQLQLVTFDGSPLDGRNRAVRFVSAWLSYCSGGLGLLWALADEENLTLHDRISETYPAEKGSSRVLSPATKVGVAACGLVASHTSSRTVEIGLHDQPPK